jgi:type II secretory pathway pseudopilin PulG
MTLIEVVIASGLFAMLAAGLAAAYIGNLRMAKLQAYRTQAVTTAASMLEQLRANGYTELVDRYLTPDTPPPFTIRLVDPTQITATPTGYRDLPLRINLRNTATLNDTWTAADIYAEPDPAAPRLPMRFWLVLRSDSVASGTVRQVVQVALVYQWRKPGAGSSEWYSGTMRMTVPRLAPRSK